MNVEFPGMTMVCLLYAIIGHIRLRLEKALRRMGVECPAAAK